ncbi:I78 family peptidase inhibitor [Yoonia maritima]|uniref:I78 family peptidase inhibitor n=1 Tax=Yoonia maritima TaxID=1435347 RepID=UPI000D0E3F94|nr:I78 family peptidase inhibitor [Yoonia maritima]
MKYIIPFLVLSACATTTPSLPTAQEDTCNANSYAALVGQDATALEKVLILGMVRTIRPDDIVTMDYRQERINFRIDANEIITSITCG